MLNKSQSTSNVCDIYLHSAIHMAYSKVAKAGFIFMFQTLLLQTECQILNQLRLMVAAMLVKIVTADKDLQHSYFPLRNKKITELNLHSMVRLMFTYINNAV